MNPGLAFLLRAEAVGQAREFARRLRTGKGVLALLAVVVFSALVTAGRWLGALSGAEQARYDPTLVRTWAPVVLIGVALLAGLSTRGLYFRRPELDLLFPAPVSRRDLIVFNVLVRARIAVLSAIWLALIADVGAPLWPSAVAGYTLALLGIQIGGQLIAVLSAWSEAHLPRRARRAIPLAIGGVLVLDLGLRGSAVSAEGMGAVAAAVGSSPLLRVIAAPAQPAIETIFAASFGAALLWAVLGSGVLLAAVAGMARIDFAIREVSLRRSHRLQYQVARMRSGGGALSGGSRTGRAKLPPFPRLAGVGPLAWRQCTELIRNPRGVFTTVAIMGLLVGVGVVVPALVQGNTAAALGAGVVGIVFGSLILSQNFAFDFHRDLDLMPLLKSLPLPEWVVAAGQLVAASLFLLALQLVGLGALAAVVGFPPLSSAIALVLVLPPLSWSAVCIDNVIFLLWPHRVVPEDPGDVGFAGRVMISATLKLLGVVLLSSLAVGLSWLLVGISADSIVLASLVAAAVLGAAAVLLTGFVAWAFRRFDVAQDVPG